MADTERRGRRGGVRVARLKELRLLRGYTVRGLAEDAGVRPATITAAENGHRGVQGSTLRKLAKALGVETYALTGASRGLSGVEARAADPAERALAFAARDVAAREGRDPRAVYARMRDEALTVEEILGGASNEPNRASGELDSFERARKAAASAVGLAEVDREGERVPDGEGASEEISRQRAGHLPV